MTEKMTMNTPWLRAVRGEEDREYTIALLPPMLRALRLWSGKDRLTVEIRDRALFVFPEDDGSERIQALNLVTGEKTDREEPLKISYTFTTNKLAKSYAPFLDGVTYRARDFCACRSASVIKASSRPYAAIKFDLDYTPWEIGWCTQ